jgi:putative SOS response-associated peptidase YedK
MRDLWLDPATTELAVVRRMLDAVPETLFEAHEVGSDVNDHRNNGPKLVEAVPEPMTHNVRGPSPSVDQDSTAAH